MPVKIPTVLILGAGASMHCGYPLGINLLSALLKLRNNPKLMNLPSRWKQSDADRLLIKLSRSAHYSVDAYLEKTDDDVSLGKYLLALTLKRLEVLDQLFPPHDSGWYQYLFNRLISNKSGFGENNLTIVTFNYDRSLEAYLYNVLLNRFSLSSKETMTELNKIPIIHVHGILGDFPEYPYNPECTQDDLLKISNSIQIIHEIKDCGDGFCNKYFQHAHDAIENAEKVYFLGFGFHFDNVKRFNINWGKKAHRSLLATTYGMSQKGYIELMNRLEPLGLNQTLLKKSDFSCNAYFHHDGSLE